MTCELNSNPCEHCEEPECPDVLEAREDKTGELTNCILDCLSDYESDFTVSVEHQHAHAEHECFRVSIKHDRLGEHNFRARVTSEGDYEMDYHEDCWQDLTMANLFCFMWFEAAEKAA